MPLMIEACESLEAIRDAIQDAIFFSGRPDRTSLRVAVSELTRSLKSGRQSRPDVITATWAAQADGLATALLNAVLHGEPQMVDAIVAELQQSQEYLRQVNLFGIDERQVDPDLGHAKVEPHDRDTSTSTLKVQEHGSWKAAVEKMLDWMNHGERFTTQEKMSKRVGCSVSTINKAIKNLPELQKWADRPTSSSTGMKSLDDKVLDNAEQEREGNPADILEQADEDAAMEYLISQARPAERARIEKMDPADRRQLAETAFRDPDFEEQENRYRQQRRTGRE